VIVFIVQAFLVKKLALQFLLQIQPLPMSAVLWVANKMQITLLLLRDAGKISNR
jgi:hypothetical protein